MVLCRSHKQIRSEVSFEWPRLSCLLVERREVLLEVLVVPGQPLRPLPLERGRYALPLRHDEALHSFDLKFDCTGMIKEAGAAESRNLWPTFWTISLHNDGFLNKYLVATTNQSV